MHMFVTFFIQHVLISCLHLFKIEVLEKEVNENEERLDIIDRTFRLQKITDEEWYCFIYLF